MTPDSIDPARMHAALERARGSFPADDVTDETLAVVIEDGIDALAANERAAVLRAIGCDPALGATVADLTASLAVTGELRILGMRREAWRATLAACAVLAVGASMWVFVVPASTFHEVQILDSTPGSVSTSEPSFAEWFGGAPLRTTVGALMVLCGLLAIPSFWPFRTPGEPGRGPGGL